MTCLCLSKHCVEQKKFAIGNSWKRQNFVLKSRGWKWQNQFKFSAACVISVRAQSPISHPHLFYIQHVICHLQHMDTRDKSLGLLFFFPLSYIINYFCPSGVLQRASFKTKVHARVNSGLPGEEKGDLLGVEPLATFPSATPSASVFLFIFLPNEITGPYVSFDYGRSGGGSDRHDTCAAR